MNWLWRPRKKFYEKIPPCTMSSRKGLFLINKSYTMYPSVIRSLEWYVNSFLYQMNQRRDLISSRILRESYDMASAIAAYFQGCGHLGSAKRWLIVN